MDEEPPETSDSGGAHGKACHRQSLGEIQVRKGWWVITFMWLRTARFCQGGVVVWRGSNIFARKETFQRREWKILDAHTVRETYPLGRTWGVSHDHLNCGDE